MSNTARILLGLALGAVFGLTLAWFDPAVAKTAATIVQPIGRLWLNALQMTVVPLVHALSVRYVGVIQVPNLAEMKARSDAQIELARENPVPSTLGARTREQFKK